MAVLLTVGVLVAAGPATAGLVVADFNDVSVGNLRNKAGGTGLSGTWNAGTDYIFVGSGDLSSPLYNITQGGTPQSVYGTYTGGRQQIRSLATPASGDIWFSFLARNDQAGDRSGVTFNNPDYNTNKKGQILLLDDDVRFNLVDGASAGQYIQADNVLAYGQTALIVGQLVVGPGNDSLKLWLNPDLAGDPFAVESLTPVLSTIAFDLGGDVNRIGVLSYYTSNQSPGGLVDNFRLSDEWNAYSQVTGADVPEPLTLALLGFASAGIARYVRRRR